MPVEAASEMMATNRSLQFRHATHTHTHTHTHRVNTWAFVVVIVIVIVIIRPENVSSEELSRRLPCIEACALLDVDPVYLILGLAPLLHLNLAPVARAHQP